MAPTRNVWHTALSFIASKLRSYGYCSAHTMDACAQSPVAAAKPREAAEACPQ